MMNGAVYLKSILQYSTWNTMAGTMKLAKNAEYLYLKRSNVPPSAVNIKKKTDGIKIHRFFNFNIQIHLPQQVCQDNILKKQFVEASQPALFDQ